jgi:ER lumen protein retaining receptor
MEQVKNFTNDKQMFMYEVKKRKKDIIFWGVATFIVLVIFLFLCSKEISVLETLSSMAKTLAFIIVLLKVVNYQNCSGISPNSLICFIIAIGCRKFVVIFFSVRLRGLKIDIINSIFTHISEYITLLICFILLYMIYYKYSETSDINLDHQIPFYYLCIPTFLIAIPFKPYVFRYWYIDLIWIYSIFLESVSIYPQIMLFLKKKGQIEKFTGHYIALQGLSTIFGLFFWYKFFYNINDRISLLLGEYSGYIIMISEIIKLFIMAFYFYLYLKSIINAKNHKKYDI